MRVGIVHLTICVYFWDTGGVVSVTQLANSRVRVQVYSTQGTNLANVDQLCFLRYYPDGRSEDTSDN